MFGTIFFDFGNVICFFDHQRAIQKLSSYTELSPVELTLRMYGSAIEEDYEMGQLSTVQYMAYAKADGRITCSDETFLAAFVDIFWPNPEIQTLIPKLAKHYRLVLASNTNDGHFSHYRQAYWSVLQHFHALGVSHQAGSRKPHRPFFEYCQTFANCPPEQCLFIDDLPSNIAAAEQFGWKGIVYQPHQGIEDRLRQMGLQGLDDSEGIDL